jgi:hypothetical protein
MPQQMRAMLALFDSRHLKVSPDYAVGIPAAQIMPIRLYEKPVILSLRPANKVV